MRNKITFENVSLTHLHYNIKISKSVSFVNDRINKKMFVHFTLLHVLMCRIIIKTNTNAI